VFVDPGKPRLEPDEVAGELARFESARKKSIQELRLLQTKVERQVSKEAAAIFAVHESILKDRSFIAQVRDWIQRESIPVQASLDRLLDHYQRLFSRSHDSFLKDRIGDVRDVVMRLTSHLSPVLQESSGALPGPLIVVADELLPSHVVMLGDRPVHGIVTQAGSQTSHAAIIARSRGIPAVSGVSNILRHTKTGDLMIVDGREGGVIVHPDAEIVSAYRKLEREFFDLRDRLADNRHLPAQTADGTPLELLANINGLVDAKSAAAMGATGVGLYRTEYLYLTHPTVPSESEQVENYRKIIQESPEHVVTIRTLDIGGDKTAPFMGRQHREANPFMGWRSIRLSFEHPDLFMAQIRAILQAASCRTQPKAQVQILFPMVTNLEELRKLKSMVRKAQQQLKGEQRPSGQAGFGVMVEVPAAALMMDQLLKEVDYVSIGSNDLVQYLMAADRDNPKVSHLCQPLSPAVLRVLYGVIRSCDAAKKPVTLCGEMAGQPEAFVVLLGMGLRRFSMSPAFVPSIKELASHVTIDQAQSIWKTIREETTTKRIKSLLHQKLVKLVPELAPFMQEVR
jgi:phosphotransferase system enzyme I (PtsI)